MEASRYDFATRLGLDYEPLGAPESESTLQIGSRNDLLGFLVEFDLPGQWLTAVGGGGVCECVGCSRGVRRGTATVAVSGQIIVS